jgi:hypothetical protein
MGQLAARSDDARSLRDRASAVRVAFAGPAHWLRGSAPEGRFGRLRAARFDLVGDPEGGLESLRRFAPGVSVVYDPPAFDAGLIERLPGLRLGLLTEGIPEQERAASLACFDRVASFDTNITGEPVPGGRLWRAVPPPVEDRFFAPVRPLHGHPRAITIGRSTEHREWILLPAKHHHDLLQVIHGVSGELLAELLGRYDVGVHVSPYARGSFGLQVGLHLAAGQLLLSTPLQPSHGLEREIDYLQLDSPDGLVHMLGRLARFPEMHQAVRVRGRLKAEQYRASRVFARLVEDFIADVAVFGGETGIS